MFSQQKRGIIKSIPNSQNLKLEMSIEEPDVFDHAYRHPKWKLALVEPVFQSQLGVTSGDTIIIRSDMLSKPVVCTVANYYPIPDIGMRIIRLSNFAKEKLKIENDNQIIVEKWEKINSKKVTLEYFIESWTLDQQLEHEDLLLYLETILPNSIKKDLKALPIALHDYFEISVDIEDREAPLKVDYWITKLSPDFPITSVTNETVIEVKSRAKRIRSAKLKTQ